MFLFLHQAPHTSALLFCFSVLCLRVMEIVLLKMLRSNLILYILQGPSRRFLYISNKGLYTLWGSTVCIHCLFLCPVVAAFVPVCQFYFKFLSRVFLVQEFFSTRQMAWAKSRTQSVELFWISVFGKNCPPEF